MLLVEKTAVTSTEDTLVSGMTEYGEVCSIVIFKYSE